MPSKSTKRTEAAMPRRQCVQSFRHAIAGWFFLTFFAGCTTVAPPSVSHPSKSLGAQGDDKYECWTEARFLTGHDPEGSSPMGRLVGAVIGGALAGGRDALAVAVAIHRPRPTTSAVESFRGAYETCLTGRGYRVEAAR